MATHDGRSTTPDELARELAPLDATQCFRALGEVLDDAVMIVAGGEVVYANRGAVATLGLRGPETLVGRRLADVVHPGSQEAVGQGVAGLTPSSPPARIYGHSLLHARGIELAVDITAVGCTWRGEPAVQLVCRDATSTQRTRAKLEESRARIAVLEAMATGAPLGEVLTALIDMVEHTQAHIRGGVMLADDDRRALSLGAAPSLPASFLEALGEVPIEVGALSCGTAAALGARVISEDIQVDPAWEELREVAARAGLSACWSEPIVAPTGRVLGTLFLHYQAPRKPEPWNLEFIKTAAHLAGIAIERWRTEEALRASEERHRTLIQQAPEAIVVYDDDKGVFVDANPRAELYFGLDREAMLRTSPFERSPAVQPDGTDSRAGARAMLERALAGEVVEREWVHLHASGRPVPSSLTLVRLPEPGRRLIRASLVDLTERRRAEQARLALEAELRHRQKLSSLGTLASGVAHEINNPIQGIMGYAELIDCQIAPGSPLHRFTQEIIGEAERVATIVRSLLTFARQDRAEEVQLANVRDVIESTLALVRTLLRKDEIGLDVTLAPDLPPIACRRQQIRQVLMNLVTNARDALNERYEGPDAQKRIAIYASRVLEGAGRPWVRITVEDFGGGIAPEAMEDIFDPFFTTKSWEQGTGLGLSISHGIVVDHGGKLSVESEHGAWTRFFVDLPVVDAAAPDVK